MKIIKNIFARIWALWGLISFAITFLIILIPSMLSHLMPERKGQAYFIMVSKIWMSVWLYMVGCPLKVRGKENFKKGSTYIVTCNHNSMLDIPISCPFIPGANKTIGKDSFAKVPLFGFFYRRGAVLVNRKSESSRRQSFDEMKKVLAKGMHMSIYPEGTRNRTAEPLKKFHDGAFKLAVNTNTAIIPAIIFNTKKALPANIPFYFIPYKLEMHFLPAIEVGSLSAEELKEKVFTTMYQYYSQHPFNK